MPLDNGGPPARPGGPTGPGANQPGGMKKSTRNWLLIGGVGAAGLVIWYVMKSRSSASSTSAGYDPNAIDPNTGLTYAQEAAGGGYGGYGASGVTPSLYGYVDPNTGAYISGVGATSPGGTVIAPSTNAAWAQQVEAYLTNLGYDPMTVAAAIGKYLTGQSLSSDQAAIVAAAQGFFGNPPTTPPPPIIRTPPGQGNGGGTTGHHRKPVPKTFTAPGGETIAQIAGDFGLRWRTLQQLNPNLRKWFGKPLPKGTTVKL